MRRYRVKDRSGEVVAEGSFGTFSEAKAWVCELDLNEDWTLEHRTLQGWSVIRRQRSAAS